MYHKSKLFTLLCFVFILAACQSNEEPKKPKAENNEAVEKEKPVDAEPDTMAEIEKAPELPKNIEEMIAYPVGEFGKEGIKVQDPGIQKKLDAMPALSEESSDEELEELLKTLYSMYKMEYKDPRAVLQEQSVTMEDSEEGTGATPKQTAYNVEIILDASGSMANKMGGQTRMELAKSAIMEFAGSLPEEAKIGLRVYGHKGTGSDNDKGLSCASNEIVYPFSSYNEGGLKNALNQFKPAGWTPLAQAINEAAKDLSQYNAENNKNIVYIVSDGIETCDGDPVAAAKQLKDSGAAPVVNIIGFDMKAKDQEQLKKVAEAAGGIYTNVNNQEQLNNEFKKTIEDASKWINWKVDQNLGALNKSNTQIIDILGVTNGWVSPSIHEKNLIQFSLMDLAAKKKITNKQQNEVFEKASEFYKNQTNMRIELEKVLLDATKQDLNTTMDEIEKIYNTNVSN